MNVALFVKSGKPTVKDIVSYLRKHFDNVTVYQGTRGDSFPKESFSVSYDMLISYLSPWIIPKEVLKRTRRFNINFHPGPPEYPGIGCFNFAIYSGAKSYGVTSHIMDEKVDTGRIIGVRRFPLSETYSVYDLSIESYRHMRSLFYEIIDVVLATGSLPNCDEIWRRKPYTRAQLEKLCRITPDMTKEEIGKRIKATEYPDMPGAYIDMHRYFFRYNGSE